jgi:hypothetical protein
MKRLGPKQWRAVYCADRPCIVIAEAEDFTVINPETASPPSSSQEGGRSMLGEDLVPQDLGSNLAVI